MQNKVQIIPDELGNVIRVSQNNADYGHLRLEQQRVIFGNTGWVKKTKVSTLLHGKVEDLRDMGLQNMTELPGKIIINESLEPFNTNDPDRDLKMAGKTGIICCQDGQPIYRKTTYVSDLNAEDTLIAHTNSDAIREANNLEEDKRPTVASVEEAFETSNDGQIDLEDSIEEVKAAEAEVTDEVEEEVEDLEDATFEL